MHQKLPRSEPRAGLREMSYIGVDSRLGVGCWTPGRVYGKLNMHSSLRITVIHATLLQRRTYVALRSNAMVTNMPLVCLTVVATLYGYGTGGRDHGILGLAITSHSSALITLYFCPFCSTVPQLWCILS